MSHMVGQQWAACVQALRAGLPEHLDRWLGSNPADWMPREAARATLVLPCGTGKTRVCVSNSQFSR